MNKIGERINITDRKNEQNQKIKAGISKKIMKCLRQISLSQFTQVTIK